MLNKKSLGKFVICAAIILLSFVFLETGLPVEVDSNSEEEVEAVVGEIKTIKVYSPTRVSVADPSIADIDKVEGDDILLSTKRAGNTTLTIWDKYGERTLQVRVYAEDLESLKNRLKQLLVDFKIKDLVFKTNKEEGKITLLGEMFSDDKKQLDGILSPFSNMILNLIKGVDETTIVQMDVQIFELSKSGSEELGVHWNETFELKESLKVTSGTIPQIFRIVDWKRDALDIILSMIVSKGKGKVLSRPKLVCLSGKQASFLVGGEVPILTTTTSTGGNVSTNVEFRSYGIGLTVKPIVRGEDIDTTITTDVSDIDAGNSIISGGTKIFAFATRSAKTQVSLKNGQTVFLAGLIKQKDSIIVSGVPFLKDIPFLGAAFRKKSTNESYTELVISLTPTIVKAPKKAVSLGSANLQKVTPIDMAVLSSGEEESESPEEASSGAIEVVSPAAEPLQDNILVYARGVQERIAQAVTYPEEARKYKWQGMLRLGLRILYDGSLLDSAIKESSGYDIFDENAISAVKKQAPFSAFPSDISAQELSIDVPVVYKLDSNTQK